ncbi:MAG: PAS domain-containing protein [Alphaproteobacteria bacterium]|nr:PAS domain-containing protein [Alphaproteobacteria bacterium]
MAQTIHTIDESGSTIAEDPGEIDVPVLNRLLSYWRSKCEGDPIPLRTSFQPRDVKPMLPSLVVVDALEGLKDFRFAVIGTRIIEFYGENATGRTIRDVYAKAPTLRDFVLLLLSWSCAKRVPLRCLHPPQPRKSAHFRAHDTLYLPFSSDGETADRVIMAFVYAQGELEGQPPMLGSLANKLTPAV